MPNTMLSTTARPEMYYKSTDKTSVLAVVLLFLACGTVIPLLSFLYAFADVEVNIGVLRVLFSVLFAVLVGAAINACVIIWGKTRGAGWGFLMSATAALWAYYLQWVFFLVYISRLEGRLNFNGYFSENGTDVLSQATTLVRQPALVWDLIIKYTHAGAWSFLGIDINGGLLIFFLILEAVAVLLIATFLGFMNYQEPFDELEKKWFKAEFLYVDAYFVDEHELKRRLENQDYKNIFTNFQAEAEGHYSRMKLMSNARQHYLSVQNIVETVENGKPRLSTKVIVENIRISEAFARQIRERGQQFQKLTKVFATTDQT